MSQAPDCIAAAHSTSARQATQRARGSVRERTDSRYPPP